MGILVTKLPTLDSRIVFTMVLVEQHVGVWRDRHVHQSFSTDTHVPSSQVRSADMVPETMHTILDVLRWSLTALSDGRFCDKRFGLSPKYYGLNVGCNTWFLAGRQSSMLWVWTALHGGPKNNSKMWGANPLHCW